MLEQQLPSLAARETPPPDSAAQSPKPSRLLAGEHVLSWDWIYSAIMHYSSETMHIPAPRWCGPRQSNLKDVSNP